MPPACADRAFYRLPVHTCSRPSCLLCGTTRLSSSALARAALLTRMSATSSDKLSTPVPTLSRRYLATRSNALDLPPPCAPTMCRSRRFHSFAHRDPSRHFWSALHHLRWSRRVASDHQVLHQSARLSGLSGRAIHASSAAPVARSARTLRRGVCGRRTCTWFSSLGS